MIATTAENLNRYRGVSRNLDRAFEWILAGTWKSLGSGRHEIDGDRSFAMISTYDTRSPSECRYETHTKYIDIQMLIEGREFIMVRSATGLPVTVPYNEENDIEFLGEAPGAIHRAALEPGLFVILFPEDAHKPCVQASDKPEPVKKMVMKVAFL